MQNEKVYKIPLQIFKMTSLLRTKKWTLLFTSCKQVCVYFMRLCQKQVHNYSSKEPRILVRFYFIHIRRKKWV